MTVPLTHSPIDGHLAIFRFLSKCILLPCILLPINAFGENTNVSVGYISRNGISEL